MTSLSKKAISVLDKTAKNAVKPISCELRYGAQNYKPFDLNITRAKGVFMFDKTGRRYFDYLAGYSSVNQGHCNIHIVNKAYQQMQQLTMTSRAFTNDKLGDYFEFMCKTFNYDSIMPTNTGVEAGECAVKLARLWGYKEKGVDENEAVVVFAKNNFWGRSIAAISSSSDPSCYKHFGPYTPGFDMVPYNNVEALEDKFKSNPNIVAYMLEPIQGEAGIIIPDRHYLSRVQTLCQKYKVLLIADEVQTGLGRTGKMFACDHSSVKPNMLLLGKALSGGLFPISCVLADNSIMKHMKPGMHGSTFAGNPLSAAVAKASVEYTITCNLPQNSQKYGLYFRSELQRIMSLYPYIRDIRGKGLMNAIECENEKTASRLVNVLRHNNILTKTTHATTLRMTPPLVISQNELDESLGEIEKSFKIV